MPTGGHRWQGIKSMIISSLFLYQYFWRTVSSWDIGICNTALCEKNVWKFVGGYEPNELEDISEVEYLLNPNKFSSQPKMVNSNYMTFVNDNPKVGRNEPCPCGSGLKYKKCCM